MRTVRHIAACIALAAALGLGGVARAEEEPVGTACGYPALLAEDDAGLRAIYEGVRLGLEKAHLLRVCLEDPIPADAPAWDAFEKRWQAAAARARQREEPPPVVFALGDVAAGHLARRLSALPRVFAVQRLAVAGRPLRALPVVARGAALAVAQVDAERLRPTWHELAGGYVPRIHLAAGASLTAKRRAQLVAFVEGAGGKVIAEGRPHFVLCLRSAQASFADAAKQASTWKVPLVCDDPRRFGQGATVVFGPDHGQVGRTAADLARVLITTTPASPLTRTLHGIRVHVDLEAADRASVELPMAFLASADHIRPGIRRRSKAPSR